MTSSSPVSTTARLRKLWAWRRYWRYLPGIRWLYDHVIPQEKCMSCGKRGDHTDECYFA